VKNQADIFPRHFTGKSPAQELKEGPDRSQRFAKEESLKEIHRVLKPGAKLGMIWNVEDCNCILQKIYCSRVAAED
jgi:hypothetical protein